MIFRARDVGEDGVIVAFLHQSHGDAGNRSLQRNARIHQAERSSANRGHRRRSVRLQNVGDDAHGVRPIRIAGKHGRDSALSQCAVADLATARSTQERDFAHRERREIVVQHEALLGFAFEGLQPLHVIARAQGRGDQGLGLTASEDRRAVSPGQHANFNPDIADLIELAAIGTALFFDHLLAEDLLAQQIEVLAGLLAAGFVIFRNRRLYFVLKLLDQRVAFVLGMLLGVGGIRQALAKLGPQLAQVGCRRSQPAQPCAWPCRPSAPGR